MPADRLAGRLLPPLLPRLPAAPVAADTVAAVQVQAEPEAGQIRQLQAELQQLRHAMAQAEMRHAADVATIATELEAARLAAAAEAQRADNEAADTARRLQAADGEVGPIALWSCGSPDERQRGTVHRRVAA